MGFTEPTQSYAKWKNIGLIELRKPLDEDWEGCIREIHVTISYEQPVIDDLNLALAVPQTWEEERGLQEGTMSCPFPVDQIFVKIPSQEPKSLGKIVSECPRQGSGDELNEIEFPEGSSVSVPDFPEFPIHGCPISGISFRIRHNPPITHEIVINPMDRVHMIMKNIFDGQRHTITNSGELIEDDIED